MKEFLRYLCIVFCLALYTLHSSAGALEINSNINQIFQKGDTLGVEFAKDTLAVLEEEEVEDTIKIFKIHHNKTFATQIDSLHTDSVESYLQYAEHQHDEDEDSVDVEAQLGLEEEEGFGNDSLWVNIAPYFATWTTSKINPYKVNGAKFSDTLHLQLFDTSISERRRVITSTMTTVMTDTDTTDVLTVDTTYSDNARSYCAPIPNGVKTSSFGYRRYRYHYGIDLRLKVGDPVYAAFDGVVRMTSNDKYGYGNFVVVRHYNGFETLYGHLTWAKLEVGTEVKAGDVIGYGGNTGRSTGPHLHFEVRYAGNAINPELIFDFPNNEIHSPVFTLTPKHFKYLKEMYMARYHTIKRGNTLSHISRKYRVPVRTLCRLNKITTKTTLRIGRKLRVK